MTLERAAGSYEDALHLTIRDLGRHLAAKCIGRSVSFVTKISHPENPRELPARGLAALIRACKRMGKPAHLADWLRRETDVDSPEPVECHTRLVLDVGAKTGALQAALYAAIDPAGPGGADLTPAERDTILRDIAALRECLDRAEVKLMASQRPHLTVAAE